MQVHHIGPAGDGSQRQRAGYALAEAHQIRHDAVMLEAPQRAAASEAGLHFVANQQRLVARAPLPQRLHVLRRRERGAATLVSLEDHARHVRRLDALLLQAALEEVEGGIRRAEAVRKLHLREAAVEIHDPLFQRRNAAGLLRPQCPAVKGLVETDHHVLRAATGFEAI